MDKIKEQVSFFIRKRADFPIDLKYSIKVPLILDIEKIGADIINIQLLFFSLSAGVIYRLSGQINAGYLHTFQA